MVGRFLTLSALVALTQAKAIVSNQCHYDVYVWSVPDVSGVAKALAIGSGKRYDEPWRYGTSVNPGIAIKVSPHPNGINEGKGEIDYQYTVDGGEVWINLSNVRGNAFGGNVTFFTCHGPYKTPNVPTRQCTTNDDVELVLCGSERTGKPEDTTPPGVINACSQEPHEKAPRRPRNCNARVVGPKRTESVPLKTFLRPNQTIPLPGIPKECEDTEDPEDLRDCICKATGICLGAVPKTNTHPKGTDKKILRASNSTSPLCDMLDLKPCFEEDAELFAKTLYSFCKDIAESGTPAADVASCAKVNTILKDVCPNFGKLDILSRAAHIHRPYKLYLAQTCKKFHLSEDKCDRMEKEMEKYYTEVDFTTDTDDDNKHYGEIHAKKNTKPLPDHSLPRIRIGKVCETYAPLANCTGFMSYLSDRNPEYRFLDDSLSKKSPSGKPGPKKPAAKKSAELEPRKHDKPIVCVNNFCRHHPEVKCKKIIKFAKDVNDEVEYSNDHSKGCFTDLEN